MPKIILSRSFRHDVKVILAFLLSLQVLSVFSLPSDIEHAYRHQEWKEVEALAARYFKPWDFRDFAPDDWSTMTRMRFRLGVALWHLGKWQAAKHCFKFAFAKQGNRHHTDALQALIGWSDCAARLGEHAESIRIAKKFFKSASPRDWRQPSPFANGPQILGYDPLYQ